jgi:hypothetical protein
MGLCGDCSGSDRDPSTTPIGELRGNLLDDLPSPRPRSEHQRFRERRLDDVAKFHPRSVVSEFASAVRFAFFDLPNEKTNAS